MNPVAMVGGVHGAGKTHLARAVSRALGGHHIVASEILEDKSREKRVRDLDENQRIIIQELRHVTREATGPVIVDGHFALVTSGGLVSRIPLEFFEPLSLKAITVVAPPVEKIQERLQERDGRTLDRGTLRELMRVEIEHARGVARALGIPFQLVSDSGDVGEVVAFLRQSFS